MNECKLILRSGDGQWRKALFEAMAGEKELFVCCESGVGGKPDYASFEETIDVWAWQVVDFHDYADGRAYHVAKADDAAEGS